MEPRYLRMSTVVYVKLQAWEKPDEAEDRFLKSLPDGMDCVSIRAEYWEPDEE